MATFVRGSDNIIAGHRDGLGASICAPGLSARAGFQDHVHSCASFDPGAIKLLDDGISWRCFSCMENQISRCRFTMRRSHWCIDYFSGLDNGFNMGQADVGYLVGLGCKTYFDVGFIVFICRGYGVTVGHGKPGNSRQSYFNIGGGRVG